MNLDMQIALVKHGAGHCSKYVMVTNDNHIKLFI